MHLFFGRMGWVLALLCMDVTAASLRTGSTNITSVYTIAFPQQSVSGEAYLRSVYHKSDPYLSWVASVNIQSVEDMMQGLKKNNLWEEEHFPVLDTLAQHWRWIVYLIFLLLLVLVVNSFMFGRKRKTFIIKGIHHDMLVTDSIQDSNSSQGLHDSLTGLPNRTLFLDRLQHAISVNARNDKQLAVVIIDLDQFKRINDSLGHKTGDRILKIVSDRFLEVVRKTDTIARLGGDEFIVLVQGFNESLNVIPIIQKMVSVLHESISIGGDECKIGASVGISIYPEHGDNSEDLLRHADLAMYKAKYTGDSILMYDESFNVLESSLNG
jgi:diguanylate cyclase (GGDEF)-like protein